MKEEDKIHQILGTENPFRVPDGYFDHFASELMSQLPEKKTASQISREPTRWERIKPWLYMAAMFAGAALLIRVGSMEVNQEAEALAQEEIDQEEIEYITTAVCNSMMDDYSLYVYLTEPDTE